MNGGGESAKPLDQCRCRSVQQFVAQAVHTSASHRGKVGPLAIANYFFKRDAVTRAAPGCNDHVGISLEDGLCRRLLAGRANELSTRSFH